LSFKGKNNKIQDIDDVRQVIKNKGRRREEFRPRIKFFKNILTKFKIVLKL